MPPSLIKSLPTFARFPKSQKQVGSFTTSGIHRLDMRASLPFARGSRRTRGDKSIQQVSDFLLL